MTTHTNPFVRGYQNLAISRMLMIRYENDLPPCYRSLHPSQAHLLDDEVALFPCVFCDDFALITEGQDVSDELDGKCPTTGLVTVVLYSIAAVDSGGPAHVGDTYSLESAQEVVKRLTFETGHFSRCWEISSRHLPAVALHSLRDLADIDTRPGLLFEAFRIPGCCAIGCKLNCTPWTEENLVATKGSALEELRQKQLRAGLPESLVHLLHLAAQANTRMLIIDHDAEVLEGLPIF